MTPVNPDSVQANIIERLRKRGVKVDNTNKQGRGFPDLVCLYRGLYFVVEVKSGRAQLRPNQVEWFAKHHGLNFVIRNDNEVDSTLCTLDEICDMIVSSVQPITKTQKRFLDAMR